MIIFVKVNLKEIFKKGKGYKWLKPDICPRCRVSKVWGHGYYIAYFDGFNEGLVLKRCRCPECGCVIRLRPKGYFSRFQASIKTIRSSISIRLETGRWQPGFCHNRQGHWLKGLRRRVTARLGNTWQERLLEAFDFFITQGLIPVSRSI